MSLYECDRADCDWKNPSWRYGFADAGMSHAMHMDDHNELDGIECPDCHPRSECDACAGDRIYDEERDAQMEAGL